jgi:PAS domain S-box-containing protein
VELVESAEILKLIISGTNAGIWNWDIETGEVYWSDNFYYLLGYYPGEIPANIDTFSNYLMHPDDKPAFEIALLDHLKYKKPYKIEARLKTKNNTYRYFECSGHAHFQENRAVIMAGCNIDIHDRKTLENKVAESEYLLSEAGRVARMGGWEFNIGTGKNIWTDTVFDIYGLPYNFSIESKDPYSFFLSPHDMALKAAVEDCIRNGTIWDLEMQMVTAKNEIIWVRSYGEPVYDITGRLLKLRGIFMDIEKYKSSEIALKGSIEVMTQNNLQLKNFTHILSHNIRNHANNIAQLTSLIETDTLDEDNTDLFAKIQKVSQGLNTTLDDLSEAIRIQENSLLSEKLNFDEVITGVLEILQPDMESHEAEIRKELWTDNVVFPRLYMDSIIMNLVTNAVKYRKDNMPPVITLRTYTDNKNRVVLECSDNGMGIDLEIHGKKIFGLYKTFHDRKDAHGVGLFLTKTQVESQGGQIMVDSELNEGTTFKIIFKAQKG